LAECGVNVIGGGTITPAQLKKAGVLVFVQSTSSSRKLAEGQLVAVLGDTTRIPGTRTGAGTHAGADGGDRAQQPPSRSSRKRKAAAVANSVVKVEASALPEPNSVDTNGDKIIVVGPAAAGQTLADVVKGKFMYTHGAHLRGWKVRAVGCGLMCASRLWLLRLCIVPSHETRACQCQERGGGLQSTGLSMDVR